MASFMEEMEKAPERLGNMRKALRELVDAVDEYVFLEFSTPIPLEETKRGYEALEAARKVLDE